MSKRKKAVANVEAETAVALVAPAVTETKEVVNVNNTVAKHLGRPVNMESARQKKIAARNAKREAGELKRGRPVVAGSKRQAVLAARAAKVESGVTLKRGRPVNANSKRQLAIAAKATKA